jgi:uncharacterized phiE125 gp8 family phage protein
MRFVIVTPPATEPVSVAEAKEHLRVTYADEDGLIATLIAAARLRVEQAAGLALITQTVAEALAWPLVGAHALAIAPVVGLVSASIRNGGTQQALSLDGFVLHPEGLRARVSWSGAAPPLGDSVRLEYQAGFGAAAAQTPATIRLAILESVAECFASREVNSEGSARISSLLETYLGRRL